MNWELFDAIPWRILVSCYHSWWQIFPLLGVQQNLALTQGQKLCMEVVGTCMPIEITATRIKQPVDIQKKLFQFLPKHRGSLSHMAFKIKSI